MMYYHIIRLPHSFLHNTSLTIIR